MECSDGRWPSEVRGSLRCVRLCEMQKMWATLEERLGVAVLSWCRLLAWALLHAAHALTHYQVNADGRTCYMTMFGVVFTGGRGATWRTIEVFTDICAAGTPRIALVTWFRGWRHAGNQ